MRKTLFAFLALAACTSSDNNGGNGGGGGGGGGDTSQQDYDDVAASIAANLSAAELPAMVDAINMAHGRMPGGYSITSKIDTAGAAYDVVVGTRGGLQVQYKLYCRDNADLTTACNGIENHAHVKPTYSGTFSAADASIDNVQRTAGWIVRDLGLPSARIGGEGMASFASHLPDGDYQITVTDTLKNALFDPADPSVPTAGTLDLTLAVQRSGRMFGVGAHLVFGGGGMATLTLDATRNYAIAVASGAVTKQ